MHMTEHLISLARLKPGSQALRLRHRVGSRLALAPCIPHFRHCRFSSPQALIDRTPNREGLGATSVVPVLLAPLKCGCKARAHTGTIEV